MANDVFQESQVAKNAKTKVNINWVGIRGNREPIDSSSVMFTYTELENYLTSSTIYDGQIVSVSDIDNTAYNGIYYINYSKDENNIYSYHANLISLNDFSLLIKGEVISNEKVISLMNNYLHDNICKNEETLSVAVNYLYSYIESKSSILEEEIQKNELILTDYFTYVFSVINGLQKLKVDDTLNTFKDGNGDEIYLKLKYEDGYDCIYLDKYSYPRFSSFDITGNGKSNIAIEYGGSGNDISISAINYNLTGSFTNYNFNLKLKKSVKNSENGGWSNVSDSSILTFTNSGNGPIPDDTLTPVKSQLKKAISDSDVNWGYRLGVYLTVTDEKNNTATSAEKPISFTFYTNRYYLVTSDSSISSSLSSSQLTVLDNKGYTKYFTNYSLPASSSGEWIYLFFRGENSNNYSSCILNGASPSDNTTIYGPVTITNSYGKQLNYYYWKKQLGNVAETVTLS